MSIRKPYLSKLSHPYVPNSSHSFSVESTRVASTHSGISPISSPRQRDALHSLSIEQLRLGSIEPRPHFELSTTAIDFYPFNVSKPEFALLTVQSVAAVKSISIHCDRPDLFQIASDEHPDYRANLRITLQCSKTYIHIRYLSDQLFSKPQSAFLFIQAESEIRKIALIDHPTTRWATLNSSLTKMAIVSFLVLVSALLFGVYTAYQQQGEWFPSLSLQKEAQVQPILTSVPSVPKTMLAEVEPEKLDILKSSQKYQRKNFSLSKMSTPSRSASSDEASSIEESERKKSIE